MEERKSLMQIINDDELKQDKKRVVCHNVACHTCIMACDVM